MKNAKQPGKGDARLAAGPFGVLVSSPPGSGGLGPAPAPSGMFQTPSLCPHRWGSLRARFGAATSPYAPPRRLGLAARAAAGLEPATPGAPFPPRATHAAAGTRSGAARRACPHGEGRGGVRGGSVGRAAGFPVPPAAAGRGAAPRTRSWPGGRAGARALKPRRRRAGGERRGEGGGEGREGKLLR